MAIRTQHLIHALALAEHGGFRKAAEATGLSQPAFSRSIARLESDLQVRLFDRDPGGTTLTVFGEALIARAVEIVAGATELEREIQLIRGLEAGELSVVLGPYPAEIVGHRAMGRLIGAHPELHCRVTVSSWRSAATQVLERSVDLALAEVSEAVADDRLEVERVAAHRLVLFARAGHPLADRRSLTGEELDAYPLVLTRLPERMKHVFPGKSRVDPVSGDLIPSVDIESTVLAREIVAESDGFSAACPIQIADELNRGVFTVLDFHEPWMTLNYGFIRLKKRTLSPAAREFMQVVRELERELSDRNERLLKM